ncbi:hypothetical protein D3C75_938920 [compost metagenome]
MLWFFSPKKSPTIAGKTVMLPPKQKATAPTQIKNSVWLSVTKLSAAIARIVTSMVKLMTRIRPTLSDRVPRMMRPAVLKIATAETVLAAVAKSIPASCTPMSLTIPIRYRPLIQAAKKITNSM